MPLICALARTPALDSEDGPDLRVDVRPGTPTVLEICGEIDILSAS